MKQSLTSKIFEKKTSGIMSAMDMRKPSAKIGYGIMILILIIFSCVAFIPILWVVLSGFKDIKEFASLTPSFFPKEIHLSKIARVWQKVDFVKYYTNSFIIAFGNWVVCILCTGLMGFALSKLKTKGVKTVFVAITWSMMIPTSVGMVPLFMSVVDVPYLHINLTDTFLPIWLQAGANAFYMLLFKNFFDSIPTSYVEAARLDGCSTFGVFMKIMLPLSMPIVAVISIFTFNAAWENFLWPYLVLRNEAVKPVAVAAYELRTNRLSVDEYMIVLFLTIIPPVLVFFLFHKRIMQGMNIGGVKG